MALPITRTLFDLLAIGTRMSITRAFTTELSWWSTLDGDVLGAVCLDITDQDFSWIVLARDAIGRFRGADLETSIPNERIATARLRIAMESKVRDQDFRGFDPQGDEPSKILDLFEDRGIPDERLHPYYLLLRDTVGRSPAKRVFQAIAPWLITSDPHLVKEFQESQFDQRLWEIYLWAMFRDQGYDVEHRVAPDLIVGDPKFKFAVEATTVAPSRGGPLGTHPNSKTHEEIETFLADYMPLKFGSSLTSKLNKVDAVGRHYWEKEGCEDLPFIIAIADFHKAGDLEDRGQTLGSMTYSQGGLYTYLYGIKVYLEEINGKQVIKQSPVPTHGYKGKIVPSGFFQLPLSENVSAVLFTNAATLSKFDRMGVQAGFAPTGVKYVRTGYLFDPDPDAFVGIPFTVDVGNSKYEEFWGDEVQVLHNHRALHPLPPEAFPDAVHFFFENGVLSSHDRGNRVLSSMTMILTSKPDGR